MKLNECPYRYFHMYSAIAYDGKVKDIVDLPIEKHTIIISDYIALELRMNILSKVKPGDKPDPSFNGFHAGNSICRQTGFFLFSQRERSDE